MSEYQYYEFRALDRPLNQQELKHLRSLSTRAEITATSFVNTYNWGDFKGDPGRLMEGTFDAFVYVTNWGIRRFVLRLPKELLDIGRLADYCPEECESMSAREKGASLVLEFRGDEIEIDWEQGEGWMASLIPLREELLCGDLRCVYLAWLLSVQNDELSDDELEPVVPSGLGELSAPLAAFAEFFEIDPDLLSVAAEQSVAGPTKPVKKELEVWIKGLPEAEKNTFLVRAACGDVVDLGAEMLRKFSRRKTSPDAKDVQDTGRRTVGALLRAAEARSQERARRLAAREEAERHQREAEKAAARAKYLDQLAKREEQAWDKVDNLIQTKRPKDYDQAVQLMTDLHDLAVREKREADFRLAVDVIREEQAKKPSFLRRLAEAGW